MLNETDPILGAPLDLPEDQKPGRSRKVQKIIVIVLSLVLAGGLALAVWIFLLDKKEQQTTAPQADTAQTSEVAEDDITTVTSTDTFTDDVLRIEFTYPTNWKVTETADNGIRVESPEFSYQTVDKGVVKGNFRIYIRKGARESDSKYIGRGIAIMPSEKLKYTNPTPDQRTETNLSFFGIDEPDNFAFFLVAGNFELQKGDSLGPNYGKEADTFIIAGGYSAPDLADDLATNQVPTDTFQQKNAYKQAIEVLRSLQIK